MAADWWSIEILNAPHTRTSADTWREAHAPALVESAITNQVLAWEWHTFPWGVVLELRFPDDPRWEAWRRLPGTVAALDAVPDPVAGLVVQRGRGGASGAYVPRRPRRGPGAAAVALPEPAGV